MPKPWHKRQKDRGVKLTLTWFQPRKRWKKYHDGKVWYFNQPNSAEGYEAAVAEYHSRLREGKEHRVLAAEYQHHVTLLQSCVDWYDRFGVPEEEEDLRDEVVAFVDQLKAMLESEEDLPRLGTCLPDGATEPQKQFILTFCDKGVVETNESTTSLSKQFGSLGWSPNGVWEERLRQLGELSAHQRKLPQTVECQVQRFLDHKEAQVRGGVITARTWGTLAERLPYFVNWIKPGTHVSTIDGRTLTRFYEWLLSKPTWGHSRAKGVFNTTRQWIRWAWRQDDVELDVLPRNIDSREFVFLTHLDDTGVAKKTRTELLWTPDDFASTIALVPADFQLYLLLMLNCGFTNVDVATLLKSEVQLNKGRIVRQRTKTRRHDHPPVVNYLLWPKTAKLLRAHLSDHDTLALTNRAGNPLAVSKLTSVGGKTKETIWTSIGRRYQQRKAAKPEMPQKQLKYLRKTGSTKLRSERMFLGLDSLYLGHSWANIADKHYNAFDGDPYPPLDEAIKWLGKQFKIEKLKLNTNSTKDSQK